MCDTANPGEFRQNISSAASSSQSCHVHLRHDPRQHFTICIWDLMDPTYRPQEEVLLLSSHFKSSN